MDSPLLPLFTQPIDPDDIEVIDLGGGCQLIRAGGMSIIAPIGWPFKDDLKPMEDFIRPWKKTWSGEFAHLFGEQTSGSVPPLDGVYWKTTLVIDLPALRP